MFAPTVFFEAGTVLSGDRLSHEEACYASSEEVAGSEELVSEVFSSSVVQVEGGQSARRSDARRLAPVGALLSPSSRLSDGRWSDKVFLVAIDKTIVVFAVWTLCWLPARERPADGCAMPS